MTLRQQVVPLVPGTAQTPPGGVKLFDHLGNLITCVVFVSDQFVAVVTHRREMGLAAVNFSLETTRI